MDYNVGHATTQAVADGVRPRDAQCFEAPAFTNGEPTLSAEEIDYFKTHGFIFKRRLLDDDATFRKVVDHLWSLVPRNILSRDDAATWLNAPHERWTEEDAKNVGLLARGNWKARSRGKRGIGTEPFLVDGIANNPRMMAVAEAFLGASIKPAKRVRGIYAVLPKPPSAKGALGPHADYMAAQISAMVFVDAIPKHSGGFTVWPGSHHVLHPHWDRVHGSTIDEVRKEGFARARDDVLRTITPVEFFGGAGDVVFWHPRLLHSAGINCSADHDRPIVRVIVPCDYQIAGQTYFDDLDYGPGRKYQWWVDTRNFREDVDTTPDNIFQGWGI